MRLETTPDAEETLRRCFRAIAVRLRVRDVLAAATAALPSAAIVWSLVAWIGGPSWSAALAATVVAAVAVWWTASRRSRWSSVAAASAVEDAEPRSRNLVVTAEELLRHPNRTKSSVRARVLRAAAETISRTEPRAIAPVRAQSARAVIALAVAGLIAWFGPRDLGPGLRSGGETVQAADQSTSLALIVATVTPPAYTGASVVTLRNPSRIDAPQGSRLQLAFPSPRAWHVRFGNAPIASRIEGDRSFAEATLTESGYLAIEEGDTGSSGRRLIPVAVIQDRAPSIRISAPAKDLLLPDAKRSVAIESSATDDYGLRSLVLRYTKISGTGEQFEFQEGTIALDVTKQSEKAWSGRTAVSLSALALAPGDSMIYRVVGRDGRPGEEGTATSETFFIEIAGPGQVALEGFEMPPDRERYALSQQMIVLKLERLRARERSIARGTLEEEMSAIAAEQRAVRANFVFLMGGEVEDEEAEAEHSHEIQEGRLENTARRDISVAIDQMTRAEQGMAAVSTGAALPPARAAVEALQRAFGKNRYFLRTLPSRSRVDASRRLSGDISSAADWGRELFPPNTDGPDAVARRLLARLMELSPEIRSGSTPPALLTAFAEEALSVDPASSRWQAISTGLLELRDAASSTSADRSTMLNRSVSAMAALTLQSAVTARSPQRREQAVRSAWVDEGRR